MDISSFSTQGAKLFDALEKLGTSLGSEFKSSGPQGEPSPELVKEFEMALQGIDPNALQGSESMNPDMADSTDMSLKNTQLEIHALFTIEQVAPSALANNDTQIKTQNIEDAASKNISGANIADENIDNKNADTLQSTKDSGDVLVEGTNDVAQQQGTEPLANTQSHQTSEAQSPDKILQEIKDIIEKISHGDIQATDLYRAQYLTAMFSMQATSGTKVSQQAAQGIESVLKQQS